LHPPLACHINGRLGVIVLLSVDETSLMMMSAVCGLLFLAAAVLARIAQAIGSLQRRFDSPEKLLHELSGHPLRRGDLIPVRCRIPAICHLGFGLMAGRVDLVGILTAVDLTIPIPLTKFVVADAPRRGEFVRIHRTSRLRSKQGVVIERQITREGIRTVIGLSLWFRR